MSTKRLYKFDNIRFFLMFLVILGHFLEIAKGYGNTCLLYRIIYLFHMPAFIFVSGYFAKYNPKKILFQLICPYVIFQFLYQLFDFYVLNTDTDKKLMFQFTTPYWILWYLLVMILYYFMIPFIDTGKKSIKYLILVCSVLLSLLNGYDISIGYYLSLSRFFTFLPFFLAGYYAGHDDTIRNKLEDYAGRHWFRILQIISVCFACFYIWKNKKINAFALYGSCSYSAAKYNFMSKLLLLLFAFVGISFLFFVLFRSNRKLPVISCVGSHTMPIFLLHGFFVKLIGKYGFLTQNSGKNLLWVILLTFVVMVVLGNSVSAGVFHKFFGGMRMTKDGGKR